MPGPVSDSYDPEWSTSDNRDAIDTALSEVYDHLSLLLGKKPPVNIVGLAHRYCEKGPGAALQVSLGERELRLCRFAIERARDSL